MLGLEVLIGAAIMGGPSLIAGIAGIRKMKRMVVAAGTLLNALPVDNREIERRSEKHPEVSNKDIAAFLASMKDAKAKRRK